MQVVFRILLLDSLLETWQVVRVGIIKRMEGFRIEGGREGGGNVVYEEGWVGLGC